MLMAIDIGNTQIVFGLFSGEKMLATWRLASDLQRTADEYAVFIEQLLVRKRMQLAHIEATIVATASPYLLSVLEQSLALIGLPTALIVGPGIKTRLRIRFEPPTDLSGDRIANSVAAHYLYGGGPAIVVDFGTATVFDVISAQGEYIGGVLTPGVRLAADALADKAARIPRVDLTIPPTVIGRTTTLALQSGLLYGHVDLLIGILGRIRAEIGPAQVIATGSDAAQFASLTDQLSRVDPHLTLHGLRLLHQFNC